MKKVHIEPLTYIAKSYIAKYDSRGFKVFKCKDESTLFVNMECDLCDITTMRFGFWLRDKEFEYVDKNGD